MYRKSQKLTNSNENLANYIEDADIYNSKLLDIIRDPYLPRTKYEITVYEYRPDLIARDFYGSVDYMGLVIAQCAKTLGEYTKGTILSLIPKSELDNILGKM